MLSISDEQVSQSDMQVGSFRVRKVIVHILK